jgi:hypothetical protein
VVAVARLPQPAAVRAGLPAGYDVTGFTLEQDKLDRLVAAGGTAAGSIAVLPSRPAERESFRDLAMYSVLRNAFSSIWK